MICPRCKTEFHPRSHTLFDWICEQLNLNEFQLRFIIDSYDGPICNDCVETVSKSFYACEVNPKFNVNKTEDRK